MNLPPNTGLAGPDPADQFAERLLLQTAEEALPPHPPECRNAMKAFFEGAPTQLTGSRDESPIAMEQYACEHCVLTRRVPATDANIACLQCRQPMRRLGRIAMKPEEMYSIPTRVAPECGAMRFRPTWRHRVNRVLFPSQYLDWPEPPKDHHIKDQVCHVVRVDLSFLDRIRVFITGRLRVTLKDTVVTSASQRNEGHVVATEAVPLPPRWLDTGD